LELLLMGFLAAIIVVVGRAYRITRYGLHIKALPGAFLLTSSMVLLARADLRDVSQGAVFFLAFSLGLPFMVGWGHEFTKRMRVISNSGEFEIGLPRPSKSHRLVAVLGKVIQEISKPIVTLEGPDRINKMISELARDEPAMQYVTMGANGRLIIDPRSLPVFVLSDSTKAKLVLLIDQLVKETGSIAGPSSKDTSYLNLKSRVKPVIEENSELLIRTGLLDLLAGGMLSDTVSTGFADLDLVMTGGYPKHSAILLCGPPSDERNLLLDSFIDTGLQHGDSCLFVTSSQPPMSIQRRFGLPGNLKIVDCYTNRVEEVDAIAVEGNVIKSPVEMSVVGVAISRGLDQESPRPRRAVVDLLPTYLIFQSIEKIYIDIVEIIDMLRKAGYTAIFSLNPYYIKDEGDISTLEELFDGILHVERKADTSGLRDEFEVRIEKMRNLHVIRSIVRIKRPSKETSPKDLSGSAQRQVSSGLSAEN